MDIEDYIDFKVIFTTMCIVIAYKYITYDENIIIERKLS